MKRNFLLVGMVGMGAMLISSSALAQSKEIPQESVKKRHIKMTVIEDGKKSELDTLITGNDVFIWKGDTIRPGDPKIMLRRSPGMDQQERMKDRRKEVIIRRHPGAKDEEPMNWEMEGPEGTMIFSERGGDSLQKKIIIKKRLRDGNEEDIFMFSPGDVPLPPMPPMPPASHLKIRKPFPDGSIDLNDPDIVSFKKTDVKGGLEKIEIVRKKSDGKKEFRMERMEPHSPGSPEMMHRFEDKEGRHIIRMNEKNVEKDGKMSKEIQVEVEEKEEK